MIGLMVAGTAMSAYGSVRAGNAQAAANEKQAQASENDSVAMDSAASQERASGEQKVYDLRKAEMQATGSLRAAYGASGVTMEGTPTEYSENVVAFYDHQATMIKYQSVMQSAEYQRQAKKLRYQAKLYRDAGDNAVTAGAIGAVGAGLQGGGQILQSAFPRRAS